MLKKKLFEYKFHFALPLLMQFCTTQFVFLKPYPRKELNQNKATSIVV